MVVMDISVGLYAHQRGAHMSRLIECIDRPGPQPTVLDYAQGIFERLRDAVPGAASWSVDARATIVLPHDGGFKPIEEICRIEAAERTEVTWGAAFKVCLACPKRRARSPSTATIWTISASIRPTIRFATWKSP